MMLQVVLGNQLFPAKYYDLKKPFFMCEDVDLCTHFKYHKHKIIFFLSSMRHFANELESKKADINYFELEKKPQFFKSLKKTIKDKKIKKISLYEIEDKFFEKAIVDFCKKEKIELEIKTSPMFLQTRDSFREYLKSVKKPFMKSFYENWRKETGVLMEKEKPVGGKFSFDAENRKKIPKKYQVIASRLKNTKDDLTEDVKKLVDKHFSDHPGDSKNFWMAVNRKEVLKRFNSFMDEKLELFGDFEDAIDQRDPFLYHSVLSPYINIGFITPDEVIKKIESSKAPLNSKEGFIRQVAGWREFMRGIYQEYSEVQDEENFFKHQNKLTKDWYQGTTGIDPLDDAIKKADELGYCHHIERLMVLSNIMLLCQIHPQDVYKWFMEMFVDSSDWVMAPNVFGMAQFSDGGIFATKPYISGSNYIIKMSHYKKGDWSEIVDGLYWKFIERNRDFFAKNYRMSMMVKLLDKMDKSKKQAIFSAADKFLAEKVST